MAAAIYESGDTGRGRRGSGRSSLSFALGASSLLLDRFEGTATRKIIDVSSNGTNNDGLPVSLTRMQAVAKGYIINAIVLALIEPGVHPDLPRYFRDNVIGGPGSFVIAPADPADYPAILRRKLVLEISDAGRDLRTTDTGALMARVDIPAPGGASVADFYHGRTVYALRPLAEDVARDTAGRRLSGRPRTVSDRP